MTTIQLSQATRDELSELQLYLRKRFDRRYTAEQAILWLLAYHADPRTILSPPRQKAGKP